MSRGRMSWALMLAMVTAAALLPTDAFADRLRCASKDYRYAYCRTPTRIVRVNLVDRKSKRPCIYNRTWGWQPYGVWVDQGCDAEFEVITYGNGGGPGPGGPGPYPPYPTRPPYPQPDPYPPSQENVPSWALGRWRSTNNQYWVDIFPNGSVRSNLGGREQGYWNSNAIVLYSGERLRVSREGGGRNRLRIHWPSGGRRADFVRQN